MSHSVQLTREKKLVVNCLQILFKKTHTITSWTGMLLQGYPLLDTMTMGIFTGLSEEVDTVKEVEQQLLLFNICVDHQL